MKYTVNYTNEVNIERVEIEYYPNEDYSFYDDMFFYFDKPLMWVNSKGELMSVKNLQISSLMYFEEDSDEDWGDDDWSEAAYYVDGIIRKLLSNDITYDEIKDLIIYYKEERIKDIPDKTIVDGLVKMIKIAMIDFAL